ncbi:MAG: ComEC/Rec2 family competence protein [Lentimonas sp.]
MIMGLLLARTHAAPISVLVIGALLTLGLSLWSNIRKDNRWLWAISFCLGSTLAFWVYGQARFPAKPDPHTLSLPAREATLTLGVKRVLSPMNVYRSSSGIAKVLTATETSPVQAKSRVYFRATAPEDSDYVLQRGQQLQLTGVLYPIQVEAGEDSFEAYLKSTGIHYAFERTSALSVLKESSIFDRFCMRANDRFDEYLRLGTPTKTHLTNIYVAMLLGKKAALSDEQTERFRMTGTMHFFAISGLHIGVIATVIAQCLLLIRVPRRFSPWIGLPLLYLYVEITGASPSAVRAFLMAACFWLSFAITRQRSPLGALATSAVAVLLIAPEQLWGLGFQLSYTVVLSILLFGLPLYESLLQRTHPYKMLPEDNWTIGQRAIAWSYDKLLLLFSISLSAWLASAPLSAGLFGFIAPGAILLNMLLVYLAALTITGGIIGISLASAGLSGACAFINHSAWVCLGLMDALVQLSLHISGSIIVCEEFPKSISYIAVIGYLGLLFWLNTNRERMQTKAVLIAPAFICVILIIGYLMSTLSPQ